MFKIEITRIDEVMRRPRQEWVKLHNNEKSETEENLQYGYRRAPEDEEEKQETVVLAQKVDNLDLKVVIKAINGIA